VTPLAGMLCHQDRKSIRKPALSVLAVSTSLGLARASESRRALSLAYRWARSPDRRPANSALTAPRRRILDGDPCSIVGRGLLTEAPNPAAVRDLAEQGVCVHLRPRHTRRKVCSSIFEIRRC
jgi:hypothetical protein